MAMEKEKEKVEATINARSADVLARKKENLEKRHKQKPAWQNTHEEIWMGGGIRAQESESQSNFFAPRRSAQADYLPKDIKTKNSGCHILKLMAATCLAWPLHVFRLTAADEGAADGGRGQHAQGYQN